MSPRSCEAKILSLGTEELKQYLPDKYGLIVSVSPEDLKGMYGSFYAGTYDDESLKDFFFEKDAPMFSSSSDATRKKRPAPY